MGQQDGDDAKVDEIKSSTAVNGTIPNSEDSSLIKKSTVTPGEWLQVSAVSYFNIKFTAHVNVVFTSCNIRSLDVTELRLV